MAELPNAATSVTATWGGRLEVLQSGLPDGFPLLYHSGTPSAAVEFSVLADAAIRHGLRVVTYSRPGYGGSEPRPTPGTMADDFADAMTILDALELDDFVTMGWSGGGPRTLACAALAPGRCRGAAVVAGVAPADAEGLDWMGGMGRENVEEFGAAFRSAEDLEAWLVENGAPLFDMSASDLADGMGDLIPLADRVAFDGPVGEHVAASLHAAGRQGVRGWRDDDLTVIAPWGFNLASIRVPVAVWQGADDRMVPLAHGHWLVEHIPGCQAHVDLDEGHLSLVADLERVVADMVEIAGLASR